jgi:hypothetical protein
VRLVIACPEIRCRLRLRYGRRRRFTDPAPAICRVSRGSDRLLIGQRQRRDHRSKFATGHVRAGLNRVFLEDATLPLQQPLEIYAVLLDELGDLLMLEGR